MIVLIYLFVYTGSRSQFFSSISVVSIQIITTTAAVSTDNYPLFLHIYIGNEVKTVAAVHIEIINQRYTSSISSSRSSESMLATDGCVDFTKDDVEWLLESTGLMA